jgi:hypothetical protein
LDYETIDKQKVLQRLRQTLEPRIGRGDMPGPTVEYVAMPAEDHEDITLLKNTVDIYHVPLVSSYRLGFLLVFARRVWWKILKPVLERQVLYNEANSRVVETLYETLHDPCKGLYQEVQTLRHEIHSNFMGPLQQATEQLQRNATMMARLQAELDRLKAMQQEQVEIIERLTAGNRAEIGK